MRALVRERIAAGDSDAEIRDFFRQRYGDFVLFRPPFDARTGRSGARPWLLVALGLAAHCWSLRRSRSGAEALAPRRANAKPSLKTGRWPQKAALTGGSPQKSRRAQARIHPNFASNSP